MPKAHLSPQIFEALLGDPRSARPAIDALVEHLAETCPHCRETYENLLASLGRLPGPPAPAAGLSRTIEEGQEVLLEMRADAHRDFQTLIGVASGEARLRRIERATKRYRSPALVDRLIEESRKRLSADPKDALEWAECARAAALKVGHEPYGTGWALTCLARADAYRGNALRAMGRIQEAEPLLAGARSLFDQQGNGDPLVEAEILLLLATLRKDQRQFQVASRFLDAATTIYRDLGEAPLIGRTLIKKGMLLASMGEPGQATVAVEEALELLDPETDAWLYLCAEHNRAHYLQDAGRHAEAKRHLLAQRDLYARFPDPLTQLRRRWLLAKVEAGLGELDSAEAMLGAVRRELADLDQDFDAALAGLDLALVLFQQQRDAEVQTLARELVPVFQAQRIEREALAVLLLFKEACTREAVTAGLVGRLITALRPSASS